MDAAGNPAPGAPTIPAAANTANDKRRALRVTRVKNSFSFLVAHISDEPTKTLLAEPTFAFRARQLLRDMPTADGLDTNESTVGRTSGNRGARGHGGLSRSAIVLQRRGESQNFLSFSFWKENDRIKSGLRPSSETDRQGVSWSLEETVINCADAARLQEWGIDDTKLGAVRYFAVQLYDLPTTQASLLADCGGLHLPPANRRLVQACDAERAG